MTQCSESESNKLKHAVSEGNLLAVKRLLKGGVDVNSPSLSWNGTTILHIAVSNNHVDIVKLLLNAKTNVQIANNQGRTALHMSSRSGNAEITKLLIQSGADVNAKTKDCRTALHTATWRGNTEVVHHLVEAGADVNIHDGDSWTPLYWAAKLNYREITELLVKHGANLNHQIFNKEYTALHEAIVNGHIGLAKYLIHEGADIHLKAKEEDIWKLMLKIKHIDSRAFTDMMDFCILHGYSLPKKDFKSVKFLSKTLQKCEKLEEWFTTKADSVPSLSNCCRNFIRQHIMHTNGNFFRVKNGIDKLPLPGLLKDFLAFKDEECESLLNLPV